MNHFYLYMRMPDGRKFVAGRLLYEKLADGQVQSYFRYEPAWLSHPEAFPLDPVNLPLKSTVFQIKSRTGLWGVMEDALPDAWGRRLIQARHMVDISRDNNIALLLLAGWAEPGATGFGETLDVPERMITSMDMKMTDQAIIASETFEKKGTALNLPDFFISGGSSAGGARPKVLAHSENKQYLIKFPSINDPSPEIMAQLEFLGLHCARLSGIPVPESFLLNSSASHTALAVERFDTTGTHGRLHFLSFQSLTGVEEQLGLPYSSLSEILKKVSGNPQIDLENLYKQMVVNVLICNCDDHLKNFSLLYHPKLQKFCLSPAYDIVPNLWQREHILSIAGKTVRIHFEDLIDEGKNFSFSGQHTLRLLGEVIQGVEEALKQHRVMLERLSTTQPLCRNLLTSIQTNIENFKSRQKQEKNRQ